MGTSKTLDRIKKLLRLAGNSGAGEHEADTAQRLAEAMMDAAGITLDDISKTMEGEDPAASVAAQHGAKVRERWRGVVAMAVARMVGCFCYRDVNQGMRIVWIGTFDQREAAIALHDWVMKQINQLARGVVYRLRERRDTKGYLSAYRLGVASAIADNATRLSAARKAALDKDTQALAVHDRVAAAIERFKPELSKSRARSVRGDAFAVGHLDGSSVKLRTEVGGNATRRLGAGS